MSDHEKFHREHIETRREHLAWVDDIHRWKLEHRRLLNRFESALEAHEDVLDAQMARISDHAQFIDRHEHTKNAVKSSCHPLRR